MTASEDELLNRISILENESNQGQSFDALTWAVVIAACLVIPVIILGWGW